MPSFRRIACLYGGRCHRCRHVMLCHTFEPLDDEDGYLHLCEGCYTVALTHGWSPRLVLDISVAAQGAESLTGSSYEVR